MSQAIITLRPMTRTDALFLAAHSLELPVTIELLDDSGQVRASQLALEVPR